MKPSSVHHARALPDSSLRTASMPEASFSSPPASALGERLRQRRPTPVRVPPAPLRRSPAGSLVRTDVIGIEPVRWPSSLSQDQTVRRTESQLEGDLPLSPAWSVYCAGQALEQEAPPGTSPSPQDIRAAARQLPGAMAPHALGMALGGERATDRNRDLFLKEWLDAAQVHEATTDHLVLLEFGRALEGLPSGQGYLRCDGGFIRAFLWTGARAALDLASQPLAQPAPLYARVVEAAALLAGGTTLDPQRLVRLYRLAARSGEGLKAVPLFDSSLESMRGLARGVGGRRLSSEHLHVLFTQAALAPGDERVPARFTALIQAAGGDALSTRVRGAFLEAVTGCESLAPDRMRKMVWELTPHRTHFQYGVRHLLHHADGLSPPQALRFMQALCEEGRLRAATPEGKGQPGGARRIRLACVAEEIVGVGQAGTTRAIPRMDIGIPKVDPFDDKAVAVLAGAYALARNLPRGEAHTEALCSEFKPAMDARCDDAMRQQGSLATWAACMIHSPGHQLRAPSLPEAVQARINPGLQALEQAFAQAQGPLARPEHKGMSWR